MVAHALKTTAIAAMIFAGLSSPSTAKQIVMDCSKGFGSWYMYQDGWLVDKVFERFDAKWMPFCTFETLEPQIYGKLDEINLDVSDFGARCNYTGVNPRQAFENFIVLDFYIGSVTYSHATVPCVLLQTE